MLHLIKTPGSLLIAAILIFCCCAPRQASTLVGGEYDASKNRTGYFVLPYGSVSIPGKWQKERYNDVSRQQFFKNADSVSLAIAFNRFDNFEFNADGQKKSFEFLQAFYEWDSKYFTDTYGLNRQMITEDRARNFVLYRISGDSNRGFRVDTYYLIGEKNGNVSNFSIAITDRWTESEKIDFLKALYVESGR